MNSSDENMEPVLQREMVRHTGVGYELCLALAVPVLQAGMREAKLEDGAQQAGL